MTKDELITRLTHELYDLKHKLQDIRVHAETAQYHCRHFINEITNVDVSIKIALGEAIDIVNLCDTENEYFINQEE